MTDQKKEIAELLAGKVEALEAEEIENLIDGISDHRRADMADMKRLGDIRRGKFDDDLLSLSEITAAVSLSFFQHFRHNVGCQMLSVQKEIDIRVDISDVREPPVAAQLLCQFLRNLIPVSYTHLLREYPPLWRWLY